MHPTLLSEISRARTADLHRQAERNRMARAAAQARRAATGKDRRFRPTHTVTALTRRLLTVARTRPSPAGPSGDGF